MLNIYEEVLAAENRIRPHIRETPLDYALALSKLCNAQVFLKCENLQYTGAFKLRGAFNKLLSLTPSQSKQGVVVASTGNHGAAVAFGLNKLSIPGIIFLPKNASEVKVDNIRNYDIPIEFHTADYIETETYAIQYAKEHNMIYVSPYNDLQVIAGQGTIGIEIAQQLKNADVILVPIGGGGLIAGIAGYFKKRFPETKIIGCLPENSPVMYECVKAGKIIDMPVLETLSDATAGGIEAGSITFELCREWVDDYLLVSEQEIKDAIATAIKTQHMLIEGAAGVALAALLKNKKQFKGKNVVVVLSGANISLSTLKAVLD